MRFLLKRKADGLWRRKSRWHDPASHWTDDINDAQVFKTVGGAKWAVQGALYEFPVRHRREDPWVPPVKHPEWFEQKFELVPVVIQVQVTT